MNEPHFSSSKTRFFFLAMDLGFDQSWVFSHQRCRSTCGYMLSYRHAHVCIRVLVVDLGFLWRLGFGRDERIRGTRGVIGRGERCGGRNANATICDQGVQKMPVNGNSDDHREGLVKCGRVGLAPKLTPCVYLIYAYCQKCWISLDISPPPCPTRQASVRGLPFSSSH